MPAAMPTATLRSGAETLPPVGLYTLAAKLFAEGQRDEATRWLYVAQIRARFHLAVSPGLRPDAEPAIYAALNEDVGRPINEWAFGDVEAAAARMQKALDWDAAHRDGFTPKNGREAALERVRGGLVRLRTQVLAEKDDMRRERHANGLENR